jgi:hypothetical protein
MKAENVKFFGHEAGYLVLLVVILMVLTVLVFPLFIALLPVALLYGCLEIWRLDHLRNKNHEGAR